MGKKYSTLKALDEHFRIPCFSAFTPDDFSSLWSNWAGTASKFEAITRKINSTAGAFLDDHLSELSEIEELSWQPSADEFIRKRLAEASLSEEILLAVRSSSDVEDSSKNSFAGVFKSHLNVHGMSALKIAIKDVYNSNLSRTAILERLRLGVLSGPSGMTIILQKMIIPVWSGIMFSQDPRSGERKILIEAVQGTGDKLVSGEEAGYFAEIDEAGHLSASPELIGTEPMLSELRDLIGRLTSYMHVPVDAEWAFDGDQLWLLQARPITSLTHQFQVDVESRFDFVDLYTIDEKNLDSFRPLPDFAQYFKTKRSPLVNFANKFHVSPGKAMLVCANRLGIANTEAYATFINQFPSNEIVLDFSKDLRQQIIARDSLLARLGELLSDKRSVFVVREFIKGDVGLISQSLEGTEEEVLVEYSEDGLLAINRGLANSATFTLTSNTSDQLKEGGFSSAMTQLIFNVTKEANKVFGEIQLEWVAIEERLYLLDFSLLRKQEQPQQWAKDTRIVSLGYATGKPIVVAASKGIEEMSVAASVSLTHIPSPDDMGEEIKMLFEKINRTGASAILISPKPYAALAALVPHVSGFIFEQASMLCHLSILLREHGVPAISSKSMYQNAIGADLITLDTTSL